jgi:heme A synthase
VHIAQIKAEFGEVPLAAVRPSQVRAWCARLKDEGAATSYVYALHARLAQTSWPPVPSPPISRTGTPSMWRAHGEPGSTGRLVPLTVDGLVYVASMVMLDAARRRVSAPPLARLALALGIGATIAVNVLHGIANGVIGAVISAWPAVWSAPCARGREGYSLARPP